MENTKTREYKYAVVDGGFLNQINGRLDVLGMQVTRGFPSAAVVSVTSRLPRHTVCHRPIY